MHDVSSAVEGRKRCVTELGAVEGSAPRTRHGQHLLTKCCEPLWGSLESSTLPIASPTGTPARRTMPGGAMSGPPTFHPLRALDPHPVRMMARSPSNDDRRHHDTPS